MFKVVLLNGFVEWVQSLDAKSQEKIEHYLTLLSQQGYELGRPHADHIEGKIKELRPKMHAHAYRVFFAFDPERSAVVILGGDKKGKNEKRWYKENIKKAKKLFKAYLDDA